MAVKWEKVAPHIEAGLASRGNVERSSIVDKLFDEGEDDDIIDAIDGLGSRIFNSVDDAKQFLISQGLVEE